MRSLKRTKHSTSEGSLFSLSEQEQSDLSYLLIHVANIPCGLPRAMDRRLKTLRKVVTLAEHVAEINKNITENKMKHRVTCQCRTCATTNPHNHPQGAAGYFASVEDNDLPCPTCSHVPDTHRKRQVRHLHCKSEGMVKFIDELQKVLGIKGGFQKMLAEVKLLKKLTETKQ